MNTTRAVILADHSISSMSGSSQLLVAQDATRSYLKIFNDGADNVTVQFAAWVDNPGGGGNGGTLGGDIILVPNGSETYNMGSIPGNAVYVTGTSGQPVTCYTSP